MGVFFYQLILPGRGREQAEQMMAGLDPALAEQCRVQPGTYRLSDHDRGTAVHLDDHAVPFDALPQAASRALDGPALLCYIYDDDFWGYELYHKGDCLDVFRTVPDALGEPDPRLSRHGPEQRAGLLARYLSVQPDLVLPYLTFWTRKEADTGGAPARPGDLSPRGDCWQLADFLRCLGYWSDGPDRDAEEETAASKSGAADPVPPSPAAPASAKPFRLREPVLFHGTDLSRCLPYLKAVRLLPAPRRRLLGLLPPKPVQTEELPLQDLDGAALERLLERFFSNSIRQLELDMELPGKGVFVKRLKKMVSQPIRLTVELLQEDGRSLCVCFDDEDQYLYWLIADQSVYFHEESDQHTMTALAGRDVEAYLVHTDPALMRREVSLMLSNLDRKDEVFDCLGRMGVWSNEWHYRNKKKHQQLRAYWCFPAAREG